MLLDQDTFSTVIKSAPLVSIDLVVINGAGQALLGQRLNRPAKGSWFVPGGRVLKDESLNAAFKRLTLDELGCEFDISQASLIGPFDHFYNDNVFGKEFTTHYVALGYVLQLDSELTLLPLNIQHGQYQWFDISTLLIDTTVHLHTQWYFESQQVENLIKALVKD